MGFLELSFFFLLKKVQLFGLYSFGENCGLQLTLIGINYYYYFLIYNCESITSIIIKKYEKIELVALLINKLAK